MKTITKIVLTFFSIALVLTQFLSVSASTSELGNLLQQEDFLNLVKSDSFYAQYQSRMLNQNEPYILKETTDENGIRTGYMAQYEVEIDNSEVIPIESLSESLLIKTTVTSLLTFLYDDETKELTAILVDYSKIGTEKNIYVKDLTYSEEEVIPIDFFENQELEMVSEELDEIKMDLVEKASQSGDEQQSLSLIEPQAINCLWWVCTGYISGGGTWDTNCVTFLGTACSAIDRYIPKWGSAVCRAGVLIACYVPKYKVCSQGYWETKFCPIES